MLGATNMRATGSEGFCEQGCGRPATCCVRGEVDSSGEDRWNVCSQCAAELESGSPAHPSRGRCQLCGKPNQWIVPVSDSRSEGAVFMVCRNCERKLPRHLPEEEADLLQLRVAAAEELLLRQRPARRRTLPTGGR